MRIEVISKHMMMMMKVLIYSWVLYIYVLIYLIRNIDDNINVNECKKSIGLSVLSFPSPPPHLIHCRIIDTSQILGQNHVSDHGLLINIVQQILSCAATFNIDEGYIAVYLMIRILICPWIHYWHCETYYDFLTFVFETV